MPLELPEGVKENWILWRVLSSPRLHVAMWELDTMWSFEELMQAHDLINAIEDAENKAMRQAKEKHG